MNTMPKAPRDHGAIWCRSIVFACLPRKIFLEVWAGLLCGYCAAIIFLDLRTQQCIVSLTNFKDLQGRTIDNTETMTLEICEPKIMKICLVPDPTFDNSVIIMRNFYFPRLISQFVKNFIRSAGNFEPYSFFFPKEGFIYKRGIVILVLFRFILSFTFLLGFT